MGVWFLGEEPTEEEISIAQEKLKEYNYYVDYILTHKYDYTPCAGIKCATLQKLTNFIKKVSSIKNGIPDIGI